MIGAYKPMPVQGLDYERAFRDLVLECFYYDSRRDDVYFSYVEGTEINDMVDHKTLALIHKELGS